MTDYPVGGYVPNNVPGLFIRRVGIMSYDIYHNGQTSSVQIRVKGTSTVDPYPIIEEEPAG